MLPFLQNVQGSSDPKQEKNAKAFFDLTISVLLLSRA
jgi:hypothetical protein